MNKRNRLLFIIALLSFSCNFIKFSNVQAQEIYKTTLLRAAPGKLLELIALLKDFNSKVEEKQSFMMRHSQGDQWDILILQNVGDYEAFFTKENIQKHRGQSKEISVLISYREDLFAIGPSLDVVQDRFDGNTFFHIEMFVSLPGKHQELFREREMENIYLKELARPQNLIFKRDMGAKWDIFTIGFYRDLKHFAESVDISEEKKAIAAKNAGFGDVNQISPYLRSLIMEHHDTLAVEIH